MRLRLARRASFAATQNCALVPLAEFPIEKCRPKTSLCREIGSRSDVSRSLGQTRVYAKRAPAEQAAGIVRGGLVSFLKIRKVPVSIPERT